MTSCRILSGQTKILNITTTLDEKRKPQATFVTWGFNLNLASTYSPMQLPT